MFNILFFGDGHEVSQVAEFHPSQHTAWAW
jgi:hypothetical protein